VSGDGALPALVLRCRAVWWIPCVSAALILLALGTAGLGHDGHEPVPSWAPAWTPFLLLGLGAGCAYFVARYCCARLILDEEGFRLTGPLGQCAVAWSEVVRWERHAPSGGPATVRIVHGPERRRLSIPLIYQDSHALEIGLGQRGFPRY
jgi:hypothetical protein